MATTGNNPTQLLKRLTDTVGPHSYHRRDITFAISDRDRITKAINDFDVTEISGIPVLGTDSIDGKRFHIANGWLVVRFSGTEPLLRLYAEASTKTQVTQLLDGAVELLGV